MRDCQHREADHADGGAHHQHRPRAEPIDVAAADQRGEEPGERAGQQKHHAGLKHGGAESVAAVRRRLDETGQSEEPEVQAHPHRHGGDIGQQDRPARQHGGRHQRLRCTAAPTTTTAPGVPRRPATAATSAADGPPPRVALGDGQQQQRQPAASPAAPTQSTVPVVECGRSGTTTTTATMTTSHERDGEPEHAVIAGVAAHQQSGDHQAHSAAESQHPGQHRHRGHQAFGREFLAQDRHPDRIQRE